MTKFPSDELTQRYSLCSIYDPFRDFFGKPTAGEARSEYNFVQRMSRRRDPIAIVICLGEFVTGMMRIVLLMTRDFTPYWKWLGFEFRKLREAAAYVPMLEELVSIQRIERQAEIVQGVCALVHRQLVDSGWVTGRGGNPYLLPLLNDRFELENPGRDRRHMR